MTKKLFKLMVEIEVWANSSEEAIRITGDLIETCDEFEVKSILSK
jgi:hypothetical protein